jgi:uncharacterized membrane protein
MSTLSVLKFSTPDGAAQLLDTVKAMTKQQLIVIEDAAIVAWPNGAKKPKTQQLVSMSGAGALGGAFWGMLFGLLFFMPFMGLAIGAAIGGLMGKFNDYGIDDKFIGSIRSQVTEGTSALFLLTREAVVDKVVAELRKYEFEIISTNLSAEQEAQLRAELAGEAVVEESVEEAAAEPVQA